MLNEGLEKLGSAFSKSGIEEITLPKTLMTVTCWTFSNCENLRIVYVEDGCRAAVSGSVPDTTQVRPLSGAMCGGVMLSDLRSLRAVAIPDGITRIGSYWFHDCDVEEVTVPASVTEISAEAFSSCKKLRRVEFADGSQLEMIGAKCFY